MNRTVFFDYVRKAPFGGRLTTSQVKGMEKVLDEWERRKLENIDWLSYMFATVSHETGFTMQPIEEKGSVAYFNRYDIRYNPRKAKELGNLSPGDGYKFRGRGLPQITGLDNYKKFGLAGNPEAALEWPNALKILFDGMIDGVFTGKKLGHYFNDNIEDPVSARRIVNGTDKAKLIAGYYKNFKDAIKAAQEAPKETKAEAKIETITEDVKPSESKGFWGTLITGGSGLVGTVSLSSVDNVYALAAFGLIVVAASIAAWAFFTGKVTIKR